MQHRDDVDSASELVSAYIGPYNKSLYLQAFERIREGGSGGWHWPAFFATSGWLLYRKMWLYGLLYLIVLPIVHIMLTTLVSYVAGDEVSFWFWFSSYVAISFVLAPLFANKLYHRHVHGKLESLAATGATHEQQLALAARNGGTSVWALVGFAFLAVPLLGVIAAVFFPAYQDYAIRAQIAEGLDLSAGARAAVTEVYGGSGQLPMDNASAGLPPYDQISGAYVSGVEVYEGAVYVIYGNEADPVIQGSALVLSPLVVSENVLEWRCGSTDIENRHLPSACRN